MLYGQPLLVSVPKHKLTLESLYQAVCERIRLVGGMPFAGYLTSERSRSSSDCPLQGAGVAPLCSLSQKYHRADPWEGWGGCSWDRPWAHLKHHDIELPSLLWSLESCLHTSQSPA